MDRTPRPPKQIFAEAERDGARIFPEDSGMAAAYSLGVLQARYSILWHRFISELCIAVYDPANAEKTLLEMGIDPETGEPIVGVPVTNPPGELTPADLAKPTQTCSNERRSFGFATSRCWPPPTP